MTANLSPGPKCPECERGHLVPFTRDEELDYDLGEETIKVIAKNVPVERCDVCGMIASGPAAAKVRHEALCRAAGLLTPDEIKAIREKFGWSQQDLADLTDFGVATISRWERGRLLPNRSNSKVLQAIRDCPPFREYLESVTRPPIKRIRPAYIKLEAYVRRDFSLHLWNRAG
jgi:putative zinc finger/helix-turn-helix YgiT family protein